MKVSTVQNVAALAIGAGAATIGGITAFEVGRASNRHQIQGGAGAMIGAMGPMLMVASLGTQNVGSLALTAGLGFGLLGGSLATAF